MRHTMFVWSPEGGRVGTTSGSGGAEHFVPPDVARKAHLTPPAIDPDHLVRVPMETAGDVPIDDTGLEGSEAGPDNPARGTD